MGFLKLKCVGNLEKIEEGTFKKIEKIKELIFIIHSVANEGCTRWCNSKSFRKKFHSPENNPIEKHQDSQKGYRSNVFGVQDVGFVLDEFLRFEGSELLNLRSSSC